MKSPKSLSTIYICMECIWLSVWNGSKFIAIMYIYIWLFDRDRSWLDMFLSNNHTQPSLPLDTTTTLDTTTSPTQQLQEHTTI